MTTVWRLWPFAFLMVMAGLQNIPRELYEAAAIDGAGCGGSFRRITLPLLRPVNQVVLSWCCSCGPSTTSTRRTCCSGRQPPEAADLISIHIYQTSFVTWNFGSARRCPCCCCCSCWW